MYEALASVFVLFNRLYEETGEIPGEAFELMDALQQQCMDPGEMFIDDVLEDLNLKRTIRDEDGDYLASYYGDDNWYMEDYVDDYEDDEEDESEPGEADLWADWA